MFVLRALFLALALCPAASSYACTDDDGCEQLGVCTAGVCVCTPGFTGPSCGQLKFAAASAANALVPGVHLVDARACATESAALLVHALFGHLALAGRAGGGPPFGGRGLALMGGNCNNVLTGALRQALAHVRPPPAVVTTFRAQFVDAQELASFMARSR